MRIATLAHLAILAPLAAVASTPLAAQDLAIRGGTVHTLTGPAIPNGTVVVENGRIVAVGANVAAPAGVPVIDATGKHVYPGLFDAITRIGLTEIGAVDVTNDYLELGTFNPHLFGLTAVHPASEHIPVARANGITHVGSSPNARPGGIGGQVSLVHLNGWTIEEMLIDSSAGMAVTWPTLGGFGGFGGGFGGFGQQQPFRERERQYRARIDSLRLWLDAARQYDHVVRAGGARARDLKLEALGPVVRGELPLLVNANGHREIRDAVSFADSQQVKIVILGGREAWKVRELLAEKRVPVILGPSQQTPSGADERYDEQYAQPGMLHAAGVTFAISTFNASDSRTLAYEAGTAVPYGLPEEEAIKAITLYPALILGLADRFGAIEQGKVANLIVTDGSPLEIRTTFEHVIINGVEVDLMNRHQELYEKYKARPRR